MDSVLQEMIRDKIRKSVNNRTDQQRNVKNRKAKKTMKSMDETTEEIMADPIDMDNPMALADNAIAIEEQLQIEKGDQWSTIMEHL